MVGQPIPTTLRYSCTILTSDPTTGIIEANIKGNPQRISVVSTPVAFRWPVVGETWVVRQENGTWYLDSPYAQISPPVNITTIAPGDAVINSETGKVWVMGSSDGSTDFSFTAKQIPPTPPNAGGEILTSTATGGMTWGPGLGSTVVARAYRQAAFTPTSANSWQKIPIDTVSFDPSGMVSTSGGRINIAVAGYYQINASVLFQTSATGTYTYIGCAVNKNGVQVMQNYSAPAITSYGNASVSDIIYCNVGDYLELNCVNTQGTAMVSTASENELAVVLLTSLPGATGITTAARAYRNAAFTTAIGDNVIPLDTADFDPASHFDLTNHRYTAPTTGYYYVSGQVELANTISTEFQVYVQKNGTTNVIGGSDATASSTTGGTVGGLVSLQAGDTLTLHAYTGTAVALNHSSIFNFLSVVQVGNSMNFVTAGGDLSGSYPTPTVAQIQGHPISSTAPTSGQVLEWNGTNWVPTSLPTSLPPSGTAGGDLAGSTYPNPVVAGGAITSGKMAAGAAATNVGALGGDLTGNLPSPTVAAGAVTSAKMATGAAAANVGTLGGDLSGTLPNPTVAKVGGVAVSGTPSAGQAIVANNSSSASWQTVATGGGGGGSGGAAVAARGYRTGALTLAASVTTIIPIDTVTFDTSGNLSTSTGRFTCPVSGYYLVEGQINCSTGQSLVAAISHNGSNVAVGSYANPGFASTVSDIIQCNAGDYIQLAVNNNTASSDTLTTSSQANYLSVALLESLPGALGTITPARAYTTTPLTVAASTWAVVPLSAISFDPGNNFNLTTHSYVCPATGYYQVNGSVELAEPAATYVQMLVAVNKNGTTVFQSNQDAALNLVFSAEINDVVFCNAGDLLTLNVFNSASEALQEAATTCYMSVVQVGNQYSTTLPVQGAEPAMVARGYRTNALTLTASAWQKIPLDAVNFDSSGMVDTTNGRIKISTPGYYQVNGEAMIAVGVANDSVDTEIAIYKNGIAVSQGTFDSYTGATAWTALVISDLIYCNAGDYLELWVFANGAWPLSVAGTGSRNYLSVSTVTNLPSTLGTTTMARAYRNAASGTLTTGAATHLALDTISYDPGNNFNLTTGKYTCPVTGYYQVNAQINYNVGASNALIGCAIVQNGVIAAITYMTADPTSSSECDATVSDIILCNAGDQLELQYYTSAAVSLYVGSHSNNYMSIVQVGNQFSTGLTVGSSARAYRTAALTTSGFTTIPLDTISFDPTGAVDLVNGRIKILTAGYYQVNGVVGWTSTASSIDTCAFIYKNGANIASGNEAPGITNGTNGSARSVSDVVYCNAGDYLNLVGYSSGSLALTTGPNTNYMSVSLLSGQNATAGPTTPARAYRNAAFSLTTSPAKIALDTISFDPGNNFSLANSRYVCPATGYYQVDAQVSASVAGIIGVVGNIYKNGSAVSSAEFVPGGAANNTAPISDIIFCNAGDYLELWGYAGSGETGTPGSVWTYLSVVQVGNIAATPASTATARAYRNAALSTGTGWTKIPLDTTTFDTSGMVQLGNGRIVCPATGYYQINGEVYWAATTTDSTMLVAVYKNGSEVARGSGLNSSPPASDVRSFTVSDVVYCNAGDYLELYGYSSAIISLSVGSPIINYLSVSLLTPLSGAAGPVTAARGYRNAAMNVNGTTKIPIDTRSFDPGNNFDITSTFRYNAPATGYYQIDAQVGYPAANAFVQVGIFKNGSVWSWGPETSMTVSGAATVTASDLVQLNAGDYIELYGWASSSIPLAPGSVNTFLSVVQVGNSMNFTSAGGDLSGTYPDPTVAKINGTTVPLTGAAWIAPTLINSWVNFGAPYETVGYLKDPLGFVHLKGRITGGTSTAFVLPAGYRPGATIFGPAISGGGTLGFYTIDASGNVGPAHGSGGADVSLAVPPFLAEN